MPYELCVFDLDGTLTDPKEGITKSYQHALSAFGIHEEADELTKFIGPPLRETFGSYYGFSAQDTERAVAKYREYFFETGIFQNVVYPKIPEALQELKNKNVTLAVATNKVTLLASRILEHFKLGGFFSFVSGDEMDGRLTKNGKRDIIRIALDALDPKRERAAVMIGDRGIDITGANEAGIDGIGVLWGYGSRGELEEAGAKQTAASPGELLRMISGAGQ
ncbi:MAG: HAD hydrolase-like protein [Oscillospiraceae bacterium]|nr:HAD hydrolase-like protein [Oscillospiraceae bacterium]